MTNEHETAEQKMKSIVVETRTFFDYVETRIDQIECMLGNMETEDKDGY